ncbi:hypothetical protein HWV62_16914 [Athelia sp. TMB]|nr:hypothetical protein HWV62_16914 [Athelia sp. TMB]
MPSSHLKAGFSMLAALIFVAISAPNVQGVYVPRDTYSPQHGRESDNARRREHHTRTHSEPSLPSALWPPSLPLPAPMILPIPPSLLNGQDKIGHQTRESDEEGTSVTGRSVEWDPLDPFYFIEEIVDYLSPSQLHGEEKRAASEFRPQEVFDTLHTGSHATLSDQQVERGVDHGKRSNSQAPIIYSAEPRGEEKVIFGVSKRDEGDDGVPGAIDILSVASNSTQLQRIASLVLDIANLAAAPPSDMTSNDSSTTSEQAFFLNVSSTHQTRIYLHPIDNQNDSASSNGGNGTNIAVTLRLPVFDAKAAALVHYCTTFDPHAEHPEPLAVEPCFSDFGSPAENKSQTFAYNSGTGVIRPMWFDNHGEGETAGGHADYVASDAEDDLAAATGASSFSRFLGFDRDSVNSTAASMPASSAPNSTATVPGASNVILVFTPAAPEVSSQPDDTSVADIEFESAGLLSNFNSPSATSSVATQSNARRPQSDGAQPSAAVQMDVVPSSSPSPFETAPTGSSLEPMTSSNAASATATATGDADIASIQPSSSSPNASSPPIPTAASGTTASSAPVSTIVAGVELTATPTSSVASAESTGATSYTSTSVTVSGSSADPNSNTIAPASSLAGSANTTPTASPISTTAAPAASPSPMDAETIASLIADYASSAVFAMPSTAPIPAADVAMAMEESSSSSPLLPTEDANSESLATDAPNALVEEVSNEWIFKPEARL